MSARRARVQASESPPASEVRHERALDAVLDLGHFEIRLAGRGGDGVVTAGEILGEAAVRQGRHAQSIPTFGPERRGAMSACTLRISNRLLLVFDPTIWLHAPVTPGLQAGGTLVFNSPNTPEEVGAVLRDGPFGLDAEPYHVFTVDATGIAMEILGRPITNTTMMGALTGATDVLDPGCLSAVLGERFGEMGEKNIEAARAGRARLVGAEV
ncbi:MAG: 2-oxoacid:acceptor oxidoreductase family protein [Planctomycetota bacterium]